MTLLICRTCPRYDSHRSGQFSCDLRRHLRAYADNDQQVAVRYVQCLGGCPDDGVAAVDGPGKARVRFTGLHADHAEPLVDAARAHHESATGAPDEWEMPTELQDHISAITLKRSPTTPTRWT